jgi:malate synthase
VSAADLLAVDKTPGEVTDAGIRNDISVGLQYLATWLGGNGAVAIFNLMEDAATAEIARSQVWQWLHNDVTLADGPKITIELVERYVGEELEKIRAASGTAFDDKLYAQAVTLFKEVALADEFIDFLTLPAYERMP